MKPYCFDCHSLVENCKCEHAMNDHKLSDAITLYLEQCEDGDKYFYSVERWPKHFGKPDGVFIALEKSDYDALKAQLDEANSILDAHIETAKKNDDYSQWEIKQKINRITALEKEIGPLRAIALSIAGEHRAEPSTVASILQEQYERHRTEREQSMIDEITAKDSRIAELEKSGALWEQTAHINSLACNECETLLKAEKLSGKQKDAQLAKYKAALEGMLRHLNWYANTFAGWQDCPQEFEHFWRVELPHTIEAALAEGEGKE